MHRLYAYLFGYFWLPCPKCGQMFGGHEWGSGTVETEDFNVRRAICPDCEASPDYDPRRYVNGCLIIRQDPK